MPIRFRCPSCEAVLQIAKRKAGTQIACPKCADAVIVPAADAYAEADIDLADEATTSEPHAALAAEARGGVAVQAPPRPLTFEKPDFDRSPAYTPAPAHGPTDTIADVPEVPVEDGVYVGRGLGALLVLLVLGLVATAFVTGYQVAK